MSHSYEWSPGACAIAGVGSTEFSRNSGRSELTLATEASLAALEDAELGVGAIDGIIRCDLDHVSHNALAESLGIPNLTYWGDNGAGGTAACAQIAHAVAAIVSGQASVVLCFRSLNGYSGERYGRALAPDLVEVGGDGGYDEFFEPYGLTTPALLYALMTRRHMIEYGTTEEQLGHIAMVCRERAHANPRAQMKDRSMTMDDYLASRWIAEPLRLFDCCLETDGACAVVVTSAERARNTTRPPALVWSAASGTGTGVQGGMTWGALMRESLTTWPGKQVAETLYHRAGLTPADIDVAQLYDCFTPAVLVQLEDFGFCSKGDGGPFAASGALNLDGAIPVNTSGGHLSEGYIHGMNLVCEGVRQIRGESTGQVDGAETCLVTAGPPQSSSALILATDRG